MVGVNFNTFLTFWADMRRLRCFCLCVTGFEKLCTRYRPGDSVIACLPCLIIVLRGTLARTPPNICDLASVLPVPTALQQTAQGYMPDSISQTLMKCRLYSPFPQPRQWSHKSGSHDICSVCWHKCQPLAFRLALTLICGNVATFKFH